MDEILDMIKEQLGDSANMLLPDPKLRDYYENEHNRCFYIQDQITGDLLDLYKQILRINQVDKDVPVEERKPIKLYIDSVGGDLDITMTFIDLIALSKTPVWTIALCYAYSAAGLILMAGHKRLALPNAKALIHNGSGGVGGSYEQVTAAMDDYKKTVDAMKAFILSHTKIDPKVFKKKNNQEWYMDSEAMLENGAIDEIVTDIDSIL